ncbi:MAG TPA: Ig-like domain-containing protein, partial [Vicinamibacterales bacterium]|nr:Ig-like domain-containing protein [Vicinamibacterales bacterium]
LMGIDAEDGGPGGHGPVSVYGDVVEFVYNEAFGGTGILVIGGGKGGDISNPCGALFDNVTDFWDALSADTGIPVTYVFGAAISTVNFAPYRMIAVVSDQFNTFCGGLTTSEHTALSARQSDIATYVNSGRGLIGFSSDFGPAAYAYLSGVGTFVTLTNQSYIDITPTPAGAAVGITDALDVCCWHDIFQLFPSFLQVLATVTPTPEAAAIGGAQVVIPVGITLSPSHAENPAIPGTTHTVTATVEDQQGTPRVGVQVRFEVVSGPNAGFNSTTTPTCNPPGCMTDANGQVSWTYPNTTATGGTDTIEACFTDALGVDHCARATKEWIAPASLTGRMTGGGKIADSTVTHGFHLLCDQFRGPQRLQVNWDGNRFHLLTVTTAFCSNDPTIDEQNPPSGFDTIEGTGTGRCNNQDAIVSWKFTDAGEPGENDTASITIKGVACSLQISGPLSAGNHQAHPQ